MKAGAHDRVGVTLRRGGGRVGIAPGCEARPACTVFSSGRSHKRESADASPLFALRAIRAENGRGKARGPDRRVAFSLIELIGVLAIIAIMAGVIVPNALKSLDRAAVRAEAENLAALGEQLKLYVRDKGALPTTAVPSAVPNWTTQLAAYADLNPSDLWINRRQNTRMFVSDPATQRAMFLSSMRSGLPLPAIADVNANFAAIWDTPQGQVPSTAGWGAWSGMQDAGDHLLIERVNLASVYQIDLRTYPVTLNNLTGWQTVTTTSIEMNLPPLIEWLFGGGSGTTTNTTTSAPAVASFCVVYADGTMSPVTNLAGGATYQFVPGLQKGDRLLLYNAANGANLGYTYVVSSAEATFDFNGEQWLPH